MSAAWPEPAASQQSAQACPRCGNLVRVGARFCDACGTEAAKPPLFESEIKYVTVLFGDVVNSTELVASRSPEDAKALLTPAVNAMLDAVHAFGGTVHSVLGDGVMALFGAPVSQEDHASRACCAALRIHEAAHGLAGSVQLRIGLASGPTLLSTQEGAAAGDLRAFGATIHLASRLQALARPGTTLCAAGTRALAGVAVEFVPLGSQALRGFGVPQDVFALTGMRRSEGGLGEPGVRGLSPYVGRERELAELFGHAQAARSGEGVAVAIVAEAGAGKSRLAWELGRRLQAEGWSVIPAGAVSYGRDVPYQLVGTLLRACFGLGPREDEGRSVTRFYSELDRLECSAAHAPALLSLLGLPLGDAAAAWGGLDPFRRRDAISDGVRALLDAVTHRQPILLLIEDLQWADDESLKALDFVPSDRSRSLLLATHRPDFVPPWTSRMRSVLTLPPLTQDSMGRLIEQGFPDIASPELREALIERSAGNPFFLEELARDALADHAQPLFEGPSVPATIQAVLAARIDRLAAEEKRMVLTAAALGNRFPLRAIRNLFSDRPEQAFRGQLATLAEAGIFRPIGSAEQDIEFSHALVQEVAYAGLPRAQQRDLHKTIAKTLRATTAGDPAELAETLVYHAERGEAWEDLVVAARTAGHRAASQSAYIAAARFFRQAIEACGRLPRSKATLADEIDIRFALRVALFPTAGINGSLDNSTEAERLARELDDPERQGWATAYLARDLQLVGRPREAIAMAARAITHAQGNRDITIAARYFAAQAAYSTGDYADAAGTLHDLVSTLEATTPNAWTGTTGPAIIIFRTWLIWALARLGRHTEAHAEASRMRGLAEEADLPLGKTLAHLSEGFALAHAGHLPEAEATLRTSLALCRKWELFAWSTNILSCLGHVLSRLGRFEEAFDLIGQATERTVRSGILVNHAHELSWLAETHRLAGNPQLAVRNADRAVEVARRHEERGNEALASFVLGEAWSDLGALSAGRECFETALAIAIESGMAPLVEQCRARLSSLAPASPPLQHEPERKTNVR